MKPIFGIILKTMSIYILCSLFSFSLVSLLDFLEESARILGLITAPLTFALLAFLTQRYTTNKFLICLNLTIVLLLLKSELLILYFEACDISNKHNFLTGTISFSCVAASIYLIFRVFKSKLSKIDIGLVVTSILFFEFASRVDYLSLLSLLYSL